MKKTKKANNYPTGDYVGWADTDKVSVREISAELLELYHGPKPISDEEVEETIDRYFQACLHGCLRPGVESLCVSLHITRTTLFNWTRGIGCSRERQQTIQRARQYIASFIEQAALTGRLNPVTSIFILKNWAGYRNDYSLDEDIDTVNGRLNVLESPGEIIRRRQQQPPELPKFEE